MSIIDIFKINSIKEENETLKDINKDLTEKNTDLENAIKTLQYINKNLNDKVETLQNTSKDLNYFKSVYFDLNNEIQTLRNSNKNLIENNNCLNDKITSLTQQLQEIGSSDYFEVKRKIEYLNLSYQNKKDFYDNFEKEIDEKCDLAKNELENIEKETEKADKKLKKLINKADSLRELYRSTMYAIDNFFEEDIYFKDCFIDDNDLLKLEVISPSVILKLHCMDFKDLRKAFKENDKIINYLLERYSNRYTTKTNKSLYQLMVIALRAELQNVLYNLKYEKLDTCIENIKNITSKYLDIAKRGNQTIINTLKKFIGEIEYLFINAVKIEYNYYVKKEKAKQEQIAIRQQIKKEREEQKALELERKRIEEEESKFNAEIEKINLSLENSQDNEEIKKLKQRIIELQSQLSNIQSKKDEIINLQNGKAGYVYVISNLGSFGDNIFKIGMTRRYNPQDRINELSSASVPFKFDVHSFIFSDDAVKLENQLHNRLNNNRVNKVNLRKEFFKITINELEDLVYDIEPTAEFNKTMIAEEFHQSLSTNEVYSNTYSYNFNEDNYE